MKNIYSSLIAIAMLFSGGSATAQYTRKDSLKIHEYLRKADVTYDEGKVDSSLYYCLKARDLSQRVGYKKGMADYISSYIPILNRQGKYKEALELAKEGIKICHEIGDKVMLSIAYNNAAN